MANYCSNCGAKLVPYTDFEKVIRTIYLYKKCSKCDHILDSIRIEQ